MKKLDLRNVTLYGADTVDLDRQLKAFAICESYADFGAKKIFTKIAPRKIQKVPPNPSIACFGAGRGTTIISVAASRIAVGAFQIFVTTLMVFELFCFHRTNNPLSFYPLTLFFL